MNELLSSLCIRQLWNVFNTKVNNHYRDCKEIYLQALYPLSKETPNEFHSITNTILGTQQNFKGNCE